MNKIICGDALTELKKLPAESVDCIMTSPPYWALRDYGSQPQIWDAEGGCKHKWQQTIIPPKHKDDGKTKSGLAGTSTQEQTQRTPTEYDFCSICGAWRGELGLEPTFELYITHLCDIFDKVKQVLKKSGTCWVNLGDTYGGSWGNYSHKTNIKKYGTQRPASSRVPEKSLVQIPSRFSIEMTNRGWILRNTIIWHKQNCMPSSAKDRFTVDFEYLFFFSKSKKYYFEQQLEAYDKPMNRWGGEKLKADGNSTWDEGTGQDTYRDRNMRPNPQGRNKRAVWKIATQPQMEHICPSCGYFGAPISKEEKKGFFGGEDKKEMLCPVCRKKLITKHFAIFPEKLCETPIKAGCPEFVCKKCGKPREKIYGHKSNYTKREKTHTPNNTPTKVDSSGWQEPEITFKGYTDCGCKAGFSPGVVLDPFAGAGTTNLVAKQLGRNSIYIDVSKKYCKLAEARLAKVPEKLDKWCGKK